VVQLIEAGLVEMKRVTQDGMRVRASAGASWPGSVASSGMEPKRSATFVAGSTRRIAAR
jgi:hypothetical protein